MDHLPDELVRLVVAFTDEVDGINLKLCNRNLHNNALGHLATRRQLFSKLHQRARETFPIRLWRTVNVRNALAQCCGICHRSYEGGFFQTTGVYAHPLCLRQKCHIDQLRKYVKAGPNIIRWGLETRRLNIPYFEQWGKKGSPFIWYEPHDVVPMEHTLSYALQLNPMLLEELKKEHHVYHIAQAAKRQQARRRALEQMLQTRLGVSLNEITDESQKATLERYIKIGKRMDKVVERTIRNMELCKRRNAILELLTTYDELTDTNLETYELWSQSLHEYVLEGKTQHSLALLVAKEVKRLGDAKKRHAVLLDILNKQHGLGDVCEESELCTEYIWKGTFTDDEYFTVEKIAQRTAEMYFLCNFTSYDDKLEEISTTNQWLDVDSDDDSYYSMEDRHESLQYEDHPEQKAESMALAECCDGSYPSIWPWQVKRARKG